jgi:hypothetical protein
MGSCHQTIASRCGTDLIGFSRHVAQMLAAKEVDTRAFTQGLTEELCRRIRWHGGSVSTEHRVELFRRTQSGRLSSGYLDIHADFVDHSCIAIEIDRGNKRWSVQKLEFAAERLGATALWIRWRGVVRIQPTSAVMVVDITECGKRVRRSRSSHDCKE